MNERVKNIIAVVAGVISGVATIFICEMINSMNIKMPEGLDMNNRAAMAAWMQTLPLSAYLVVLAGYIVGAIDGAVVATLVSGRTTARPAVIVGVVLTVAGIMNVMMLPQPGWFVAASLSVSLPFAYLGYLLARKRSAVL
jgi:hypothetical protein